MGIFDLLFAGGGKKAELSAHIDELAAMARAESQRQGMNPKRALVWETLCEEASGLMRQLLIKNSLKEIDWDLKKRARKANYPDLVGIYWWMLLYQLVLFKNRGVNGQIDSREEFSELSDAAHEWVSNLVSTSEQDLAMPQPWEDRWHSQVSLEAALGLYNRMAVMFDIWIDPDARVFKVSHFTTATERAYDAAVQKYLSDKLAEM